MRGDNRRYSEAELKKYREELEKREKEKRLRVKKRRKRERAKRRLFGAFFLLLILLSAVIIILKTPLFSVKTLTVEGNTLVDSEKISAASGLGEGESIFNHTSSYSKKAIEALPYISEATVKKKLPSTVTISVSELTGEFLLELDTGNFVIDKNGKSIKEAEGDDLALPKIKGCTGGAFSIGRPVVLADENATKTLLRCLKSIDEYGFTNITELDLSDEYNIVMVLSGSLKIKIGSLGSDDELSYKMAYIREVLGKLPENMRGVIDASNPDSGVSYRSEEEIAPAPEETNDVTEGAEGENGGDGQNTKENPDNQ